MNKYLIRYLKRLNEKPIMHDEREQIDKAVIVLISVTILAIALAIYFSGGVR